MTTATRPDYSFVRSPRWIFFGVVSVAAIVAFIALGFWQLRRLDERRADNIAVSARLDAPPAEYAGLVASGDLAALEYRATMATGEYDATSEVVLRSQAFRGVSGSHRLTPLLLDDGRAVLVDRGWVPEDPRRVEGDPTPPSGTVTVTGWVRPSGEAAVDDDEVLTISEVDVEAVSAATGLDLLPGYLVLQEQSPPQAGDSPVPADGPRLTEGPHKVYALQWFLFAVIVAVGYPALIVRTAREPLRRRTPRFREEESTRIGS